MDPVAALRRSEERFRKIFHHTNDAIFVLDAERGEILDCNDKATRVVGYTRAELVGADLSLLHPHELQQMRAFARCVVERGEGFTELLSCRAKDGRLLPAEISASRVDMDGRDCIVALVRDVSDRERLARENACLKEEIRAGIGASDLIGDSPPIVKVREQIAMVAKTDANVLITGESGTGKELVARAIVDQSQRARGPLVKVNCPSIPAELFESEFFGHVRGAFSGAHGARQGRFELAEGGTLFLDEIGEIPLFLQGKLLRVLQERQFEPVGDSRTRNVDVRIIAATNRDLLEMCRNGRFREDLYYRLSVFPIEVPALRERIDDIPLLASHAIELACLRNGFQPLSAGTAQLRTLQRYPWPGNVRELFNTIDRAVIVGGGRSLALPDLSPVAERAARTGCSPDDLTLDDLKHLERQILERALRESQGRIYGEDGAAARLGLRPTTLVSKLKRWGLRG